MSKSLIRKSKKLLTHPLLFVASEFLTIVLIIAFISCIIVYINKINRYRVIDQSDNTKSIKSINRPLQMFIYVMAWIILIVLGLFAIRKTNIF